MLTARFGTSLRNLARESFEGNKLLTQRKALANHNIVKAYRAEARERKRFTEVAKRIVRAQLRTAKILGFAPPTIEMIGVVFAVVLLFFGQREIASGHMTPAQFLTFIFFLFRSYDPMRKLSRLHNAMEQALAAAHHVWEAMDEHAEIPEREGAVELGTLSREIELRSVSFGYANESKSVLREVSLAVPAGHMVAWSAESGGGKSTLTKLLPAFTTWYWGRPLGWTDLQDAKISACAGRLAW